MRYEFTFWRFDLRNFRELFVTMMVGEKAAKIVYEAYGVSDSGWDERFKRIEIEEQGKKAINSEFQLYSVLKIPK
ncbi:hypothetical protein [Lactiplantibacillus paraxiangfangensis]|uniref:hypothetical protein n=1 Tax=Lactiplantibacillus paraxiangfangensis TaxID=3076224 RepID=UPI0030C666F8